MDRWEQISGIVRATLALTPDERHAYLSSACGGDDGLRRQVEALLTATDETRTVSTPIQRLPTGADFAHYRIISQLGAGGMGEVYRARDERLDRDVAVKVLPPATHDDPGARARLVREAKAVAALNHPNVCTVHEVGEANGQAYITMELVEGQTLSARLHEGPLALDKILHYGRQLAEALSHAHDRGVVHRDLKSNNVIVTPDDRVKVLDFGLAKRSNGGDATGAVTEIQVSLTQPGTAVGTLPYMAPEQLRGQTAGLASDIWALGVVLYEMAAGRRPFTGQTPFEVSAAIIGSEPAPLPAGLPAALDRLIRRCLEKDPNRRWRSAAEVRAALEAISTNATPVAVESAPPPAVAHGRVRSVPLPTRRTLAIAAAAVLVAASAVALWHFWPQPVRKLAVLPFANVSKDTDLDYLSEGIPEALIPQIGKQPSIAVSNLAAVLRFKAPVRNPPEAGRELGVDTVVTGSFEPRGSGLTISAQLVDVASGRQLWSARYDRDAVELLDVQDQIARAILTEGLKIRMTQADEERLVKHPTTDGDAYDLYLQARYMQRPAREEDYLYSRQLLLRAVTRDPNFALGYAALSGNYAMMVVDGLERPSDAWPQVSKYMKQAAALDPDLPDVHAFAHAFAFLADWDWQGAERERRRLLQYPLRDLDPQVLRAMAVEHWALGRTNEALQLARRMRELDPASPYLGTLEADYLVYDGQYDAAIPLYERSIKLDPANENAYFGLAEARARQRRFDQAVDVRRKAHEVAGDDDPGLTRALATAKGEEGYRAIERAWVLVQLEALKTREKTSYTSPLDFARVYAQLGDKEQAFKFLDASFTDHSPGLVFIKVDRAWDLVRDDPRFAAAIQRLRFP